MNSYEAKRGFLTFISTLVIAGGIFIATYFTVNSLNLKASNNYQGTALGVTDNKTETDKTSEQEQVSVFAALLENNQRDVSNKPVVFGGTEATREATSGAVPVTGSNFISGILLLGGSFILLGWYLGIRKTRNLALRSFEKKVSKEI